MDLFYRQLGTEGRPLVILHGLFGMSDNWLSISKSFLPEFQVYLVDLRNHGQSPASADFSYPLMADDMAQFITKHQLSEVSLIGHSMGGKVLMNFADRYRDLYQKLIIVDIAPRFYPVHHTAILQGLKAIDLTKLQSRTKANEILKNYEESEAVRQFLLKNLWRNPATGQFDWRMNLSVLTAEIAQIGEEQIPKETITAPTLFMSGAESSYVTAEDQELIKKYYSDVQFEIIDGAGHWVQAEKPQEFIQAALKFLQG